MPMGHGSQLNNPPVCPIARGAGQNPAAAALSLGDRVLSYGQLDRYLDRLGDFLRGRGVKPGMGVGLWGRPSLEQVAATAALWRAGITAVPLNRRFPPAYVGQIARKLGIAYFVVPPHGDDDSRDCGIPSLVLPPPGPGDRDGCPGRDPAEVTIDLDYRASVILTSGSSGEAKALCHTYGNHHYSALGANINLALAPGDRWLLSLPLCHVGGLGILFRCFLAGATVVLPGEDHSPAQMVARCGITHLSLVATQLRRLLDESESAAIPLHGLKGVLVGGGAVAAPLIRRAVQMGLPLLTTYGMSETASQVTTTGPGDPPSRLFTSGKVLPYRSLKIDQSGEICVKGPVLFKGYLEDGGTVLPLDEDGWFKTGDLGVVDGDGYLTVMGRKDNMFISGGENVVPEEIEAVIERHPAIARCLVAAVPDDEYGARPAAFLKYAAHCSPDPEALLGYLRDKLPGFKIPDAFYRWPTHLEGDGLKISRPRFLELLQRGRGVLLFKKHR